MFFRVFVPLARRSLDGKESLTSLLPKLSHTRLVMRINMKASKERTQEDGL